jgi:hypothetical protein
VRGSRATGHPSGSPSEAWGRRPRADAALMSVTRGQWSGRDQRAGTHRQAIQLASTDTSNVGAPVNPTEVVLTST